MTSSIPNHILIGDTGVIKVLGSNIPKGYRRIKKGLLFSTNEDSDFIYKITPNLTPTQFKHLNSMNSLQEKLHWLNENSFNLTFVSIKNEIFRCNLQLVDSKFPEIMAWLLYYSIMNKMTKWSDLLNPINRENPIKYDFTYGQPFYKYKIQQFLYAASVGMTSKSIWTGIKNGIRGVIIETVNGELVCYHIYNKNRFEDYLFDNTKLNTSAVDKHKYERIYSENGICKIKLNLQVRFIK